MTATHFELPANLTAEKLIAALSDKVETQLVSRQYLLKTYYDSFDWRLYRQGLTCEFNRSKQTSSLMLTNRKNGELIASTLLFDVPSFCHQFNPGKVRQTLEPLLGVRALLAVCTLECETYHLDIVNKDEKTVLRVLIEEFELLNNRLTLFPVKGYDKVAEHVVEMVTKEMGLCAVDKPVLLSALRLQGRQPKDYSSKLDIHLTPEMHADIASKTIFSYLLRAIKLNEQGTIADTDSEFLHDFRVAVRRTRAGLSQVKNVLPEDVLARYGEFFSWLGQITGETRDLDVYLLSFEQYKKKLPAALRQSINPLQHFLAVKKQKSQKQLAKKLRSAKYLTMLAEWEAYLSSIPLTNPTEADSKLTVKELADQRIWKTYKQAIKQGMAIDWHSPPEALHKLRKTCKKLRYLMEFFQNLYPERRIDKLIKRLKQLQEVLGDYQDYAVQQERLQQFSEEMQSINTPTRTFLAMGVLIQDFESRKSKARDRFASQFAAFKKPRNHAPFHALFAPKKA
ncbi:CHAD domain-containing protein [Methyloglobulus sp.]|uniref:CHAD domain-containing protein n=1 Tax=Methyloglobulus sp. TaxID=2518622 RepID=UPI0017917B4B|nr:CHAD domain-containing protein [Methyloglobulus sp.]